MALCTTHLGKPDLKLTITEDADGYIISGELPWCKGIGLFDVIFLGVEINGEVKTALTNFENIEIEYYNLGVFNGTSSAKLKLKNKKIFKSQFLNYNKKLNPTEYQMPELGIAKRILYELEIDIKNKFTEELSELEAARNNQEINEYLIFRKDQLIKKLANYLILNNGSKSIRDGSLEIQIQKELVILDVVYQPLGVKELKRIKCASF